MKPKPISTAHLQTNQQQVRTPSWGAYNNTQRHQFQKMSRLDELLSRNEEIYQNMRNQLQEISKSNQNIDANINIIKPFYQSGGYGDSGDDGRSGGYKQSYTFDNKVESIPSSNNSLNTKATHYGNVVERKQEPARTLNVDQPKKLAMTTEQPPKSKQSTSTPANSVYLLHQPKKVLQKVPSIAQSDIGSYHEPDSSPIQSQTYMQSIRSNQFQRFKEASTNSYLERIKNKYLQTQSQKNQSRQKYQTFEEDPRICAIDEKQQQLQSVQKENMIENFKKQQNSQYHNETDNNQTNRNLEQQYLNIQKPTLPQVLALVFIPFNRLYSSPILQQVTKNQLILARKSKTQVVVNNCVNRIVNGIKYKNLNLCSEEIGMYEKIMERVRKVDDILRAIRQRKEFKLEGGEISVEQGEIKDSVDIGIIGGHNSLKKKLHYALIAHIYTDILNHITSYFQSQQPQKNYPGTLLFTIQHQQQQTNSDPSIISYQGELSPSQTQSQNHIVYANIEAVIQQIFEQMKTKTPTPQNHNIHRIRVTRLCLQIVTIVKQRQDTNNSSVQVQKLQTISNIKIISTNKIQKQFIDDLQLDITVWCVNPLFKYYDETYDILQCYSATTGPGKKNVVNVNSQMSRAVSQAQISRKETKRSFRGGK